MATSIIDIHQIFLSKISSYRYAEMTPQELANELNEYMEYSITEFYKCRKPLELSQDGLHITVDLTLFEQKILAQLMLVEYMNHITYDDDVIRQSLSDKDFKIYSQASHGRGLELLQRNAKKLANKMITEYTYMELLGYDKK